MNLKSKSGFSLVELLVLVAVMAILLSSLTAVLINSMDNFANGQEYLDSQVRITDVFARISRDVNAAKTIDILNGAVPNITLVDEITFEYVSPAYIPDAGQPLIPTSPNENFSETWLFENGALSVKRGGVTTPIITGLKVHAVNASRFIIQGNSTKGYSLILYIHPDKGSSTRMGSGKIEAPVNYQFPLKNKYVILRN